jgi:predicted nucleic acid-binding Zn ribbon protein
VPFYEYKRPDGTIFEVMQRMTDAPLTEDPDTGVPVQRVFRPIAVHFKGKGFYNTDYGTKKRARETASSSDSKSDDKKSTDGGSADKADATPSSSSSAESSDSKTSSTPASSD